MSLRCLEKNDTILLTYLKEVKIMTYNPNENYENKQAQEPVNASPFQSSGANQQASAAFQGGQAPFINPPLTVKKPTKLGWIITLVLLIFSVIGLIFGSVLMFGAIGKIDQEMGKENSEFPRVAVDSQTYIYSRLETGKSYYLLIEERDDAVADGIYVDGTLLTSSSKSENTKNNKRTSLRLYKFTAKSNKAKVRIDVLKNPENAAMSISSADKYDPILQQLGLGIMLLAISGVGAFITFILFIIFMIIFAMKNSKYKSSLRNNMMA